MMGVILSSHPLLSSLTAQGLVDCKKFMSNHMEYTFKAGSRKRFPNMCWTHMCVKKWVNTQKHQS